MKPRVTSQCSPAAGPDARPAAFALVALAALALGAAPAFAGSNGLSVKDGWMRTIIPSRPAAGYFTLSNTTDKQQVLVGAESPACGMLMLHQSQHKSGMEHMAMVKSVVVPAHGKVTFAPGGYHLMCTSPTKELVKGHNVPVTLHFADKSSLTAQFAVRGVNGK
ncbi:MAG: copper chaperone PCu(A)C [Beijerinckiaceae bacterium]|nr:MAG: copper chaperone PCu(A)C [Beijerinckiaceae bacterium]